MRNLILIAMSAMALAACSLHDPETGARLVGADCDKATVIHDYGFGPFGGGKYCYTREGE